MVVAQQKTYADFLAAQGEPVFEIGGSRWMRYGGALIPASAMPVYGEIARDEALRAIRRSGSLFLRYTSGPLEQETDWWHVVCRAYRLEERSASTRSKIRRGLNRLSIDRVEPAWLADHGYDCHVKCYERYQRAQPLKREEFRRRMLAMEADSPFEIWVCRAADELVGYIVALAENDGVFLHTVDIAPEGLRKYAAYAMIHHLLNIYINDRGLPVSNGSRSISHATEMQDFLLKFGFQREFCLLHVIYRPVVALAVRALYPLRTLLKRLEGLPLLPKVSALLFQEELVRCQRARRGSKSNLCDVSSNDRST